MKPHSTTRKLKCSLCNNSLSYFPIFLTEGDKNVCGRCSIPEGTVHFRNRIFEEVTENIKFPCRYKEQGCCEELYPEDVPSHEKKCCFRKIVECPKKCSWRGPYKTLLFHCRTSHIDRFLQDRKFKLNLKASETVKKFLEIDGALFEILMEYNHYTKTLYSGLYHVLETVDLEDFSYQIVLSKDGSNITLEGVTTSYFEVNRIIVSLNSLIEDSTRRTPWVLGRVIIEKNAPTQGLDKDVLSLLRCSECDVHVLPPIYLYEEDRIKCDKCGSGRGSRNFSLDRIAEKLNYPCRYEKNGCRVVLGCEQMKKHLSDCPFVAWYCPFDDKWSGLISDFKSHILEKHSDILIQNGEEVFVEGPRDAVLIRIIHYSAHLFQMKYSKGLIWVVDIVGHGEGSFQFEIDMKINQTNNRLVMERKCVPLARSKTKEIVNGDNEIFCTLDNYKMFGWKETEQIAFKIRVVSRQ